MEDWKTGKVAVTGKNIVNTQVVRLKVHSSGLGLCGEFHSCSEGFRKADQITEEEYQKIEEMHYEFENGLLRLIKSLQKKQINGDWKDSFQ